MNIGLYNLEPKIINVALMKVSQYHKSIGNSISIYNHLDTYDKVYAFSIFDFTDKSYVTKDMICGGTGFQVTSRLPEEIEACDYDWSIYPNCDYSIVWFSQGCIRNCPWCIVRQKEGYIRPVKPKNLNPRGTHIKVMDNNFFANPEWRNAIQQLLEWGQPVDFNGVDARILDKEMCEALNKLKHYKQIHIAWDNPLEDLEPKLREICTWIKAYKIMCYVLIGYNSTPEQDMHRVKIIDALGMDPFVMPYNKKDKYQNRFARWVNMRAIFKTVKWEDYDR